MRQLILQSAGPATVTQNSMGLYIETLTVPGFLHRDILPPAGSMVSIFSTGLVALIPGPTPVTHLAIEMQV